jgi:hypothetical protein
LDMAFWNPGVSNSILPQPGDQAPFSVLLDSTADSVTWTMGFADGAGPISMDLFFSTGGLVASVSEPFVSGYNGFQTCSQSSMTTIPTVFASRTSPTTREAGRAHRSRAR